MKKILLVIMAMLWSGAAGAAMTCVDTSHAEIGHNGDYELIVTCTVDTTPGTAVAALPSTIMDVINGGKGGAKYVYSFATIPGSTGPTDNSDLAISSSVGTSILSASGNGANVVDNTAVNSVIYGDGPTPGSTNHNPKADGGTWTITLTNNAVNSSSFKLLIQVGPHPGM